MSSAGQSATIPVQDTYVKYTSTHRLLEHEAYTTQIYLDAR